jgi:threonine dehydratase
VVTGLCRHGDLAEVYGAEPLLGNDAARSFREGRLIPNETEPMTLADGARTISLGNLNWPIIRDGVKDFIEVSDERIAEAVRLYYDLTNLKSEPTGALTLGALFEQPERFAGKNICLVVSGGNVDPAIYKSLI